MKNNFWLSVKYYRVQTPAFTGHRREQYRPVYLTAYDFTRLFQSGTNCVVIAGNGTLLLDGVDASLRTTMSHCS